MLLQVKNQTMNKKFIQIESVSSEDFIESLLEQLTQKFKEECNCCNEPDISQKQWLTTKEACEYFKVSQPTLKRMRDNGEVEYRRVGKNFRYLRV